MTGAAVKRLGSRTKSSARPGAGANRPRQSKPAQERILEVASLLFAERGFAAVTTRQIAAGANVKFPILYRHFHDKRTLYLTAFGSALARADAKYIALLQQPDAPEVLLFAFVSGLYDDLLNDPCISKLMQREILDQDDSGVARLTKDYFVGPYRMVKDLCAQLTGRGVGGMGGDAGVHRHDGFLAVSADRPGHGPEPGALEGFRGGCSADARARPACHRLEACERRTSRAGGLTWP